jgi:DNA-binding LacI/PurR family transcriptional regulator
MATIKEVAALAGVFIGTVSHVITGSAAVVARSLKTSRTRTLGIIVPDLTISFYPQVIRGAETAALKRGYSLIAVNSADSAERQRALLSLLRSQQVEGILLVLAQPPASIVEMSRVMEAGIPLVFLNRIPEMGQVDSVSVEDASAVRMGVDHLLSMGYRRIAIVTGPLSLMNERQRLWGYEQSLERAGLAVDDELVWQGNTRAEDVAALCTKALRRLAMRPEAIFCTNGPTALGALRALRNAGLRTPEDLGFLTFDELTVDDLFTPAMLKIRESSRPLTNGHI